MGAVDCVLGAVLDVLCVGLVVVELSDSWLRQPANTVAVSTNTIASIISCFMSILLFLGCKAIISAIELLTPGKESIIPIKNGISINFFTYPLLFW